MTPSSRTAAASALAAALLAAGAPAASGHHVTARDTTTACPVEEVGSRSEGYSDTDGSVFAREIACVSDYGVALGTGDGRFAPQATVTRAQMARFLARLAELARMPLQTERAHGYQDIGGLDAETQGAINAVTNLGIAYGVDAERTLFAPAAPVSRGQMAAFLERFHQRAVGGNGFSPARGAFDDDDASVHEIAIEHVAGGGIATGLGGEQHRLFAPGQLLTRGQMAGFLARLLDAEVDAEVIGSTYDEETELVEGVVVTDNPLAAGLDVDGDGQGDREVAFDDDDVYLLGDREVPFAEFRSSLSHADRLRVEYAAHVHRTSRVALVDDWVFPPSAVLATVLVGDDGVQDDVRIAWSAYGNHDGVVDRLRSTPGADGRCGTADDPAYQPDGRIVEQPGSAEVLFPAEPGRAHPVVVDEDRLPGACYRYAARAVSDAVPGSTPGPAGEPSNAVRIGGEDDTTPPQLVSAELVREESGPGLRVVRYAFDEPFVQPAQQSPFSRPEAVSLRCYRDEQPPYEQEPYEDLVFVERAEGSAIVASLQRDRIPACDTAYAKPVGVVDEKGNADPERQAVPYAGMG